MEITLRSSSEADAAPIEVIELYLAGGETVRVISKAEYLEILAALTPESVASIDQEQVASVIALMNVEGDVPMVLAGVAVAGPAVAEESSEHD